MGIVTPVNLGKATSAGASSLAITTAADIAKGDLITVFHNSFQTTGTVSTIVDPAASTYLQAVQQATTNCAIYYGIAAAPIATGSTITVNFNGGAGNRHAIVLWNNPCAGGTWALDVNAGTATGTATSSGTLTYPAQAQAIELLVAMLGTGNVSPGAVTWDQGFTSLNATTSVDFLNPAYLISAAASGNTVTPSWVNNVLYRTIAVSFQLTPPAPPPTATPASGGGGSTQYGRRRQRLKDQPSTPRTYNPRYEIPPATKAQLKETAEAAAVEKLAEIEEAAEVAVEQTMRPPLNMGGRGIPASRSPIIVRPAGPTWADMTRARVELERLKQDLIARQDEDDVELLLMAIH